MPSRDWQSVSDSLTRSDREGERCNDVDGSSPSLARFEVALFWICPLSPVAALLENLGREVDVGGLG
jgi:hypothetical protein